MIHVGFSLNVSPFSLFYSTHSIQSIQLDFQDNCSYCFSLHFEYNCFYGIPDHFPVDDLHDQFCQHGVLWSSGQDRTSRSCIINCGEETLETCPLSLWHHERISVNVNVLLLVLSHLQVVNVTGISIGCGLSLTCDTLISQVVSSPEEVVISLCLSNQDCTAGLPGLPGVPV